MDVLLSVFNAPARRGELAQRNAWGRDYLGATAAVLSLPRLAFSELGSDLSASDLQSLAHGTEQVAEVI